MLTFSEVIPIHYIFFFMFTIFISTQTCLESSRSARYIVISLTYCILMLYIVNSIKLPIRAFPLKLRITLIYRYNSFTGNELFLHKTQNLPLCIFSPIIGRLLDITRQSFTFSVRLMYTRNNNQGVSESTIVVHIPSILRESLT